MIALDRVTKGYRTKVGRRTLFADLTFRFPDRNVAIMGPNGAGKSTLMRLVAGTELPDAGRVLRSARVSWPLGFSGGFNGTMTGVENARFVARIYGADPAEVLAYVEDFAELGPALRQPIRTYSSGMKARLAFGLSMAVRFDVYLIDEITAVGDDAFRRKSQRIFRDRLATSRIVMISHSEATIRDHCDCGLLIDRGRVTFHADVGGLIDAYRAALAPA